MQFFIKDTETCLLTMNMSDSRTEELNCPELPCCSVLPSKVLCLDPYSSPSTCCLLISSSAAMVCAFISMLMTNNFISVPKPLTTSLHNHLSAVCKKSSNLLKQSSWLWSPKPYSGGLDFYSVTKTVAPFHQPQKFPTWVSFWTPYF